MIQRLALAAALLLAACGHHGASHGTTDAPDATEGAPAEHSETSESSEHATPVALSGVHAVHCGCVLEDINKCGNYIEVEGQMLALQGDIGLGKMEFCGKEGLEADVTGALEEGAFVATAFQLVE